VCRQGILNLSAERTHVVNLVKAGRNTSATTQFVRLQPGCRYKTVQEAILITFIKTKSSPYRNSSIHCCDDVVLAPSLLASEFRLPAAGHPAAPRPSTQPTVDGRSWVPERSDSDARASHGQSIRPLPALCNRHAKAGRSDLSFSNRSKWGAIWYSALHWQCARTKVCFKAFTTLPKQHWNLTNSCRVQCGTSHPTQVPNEGMRTTASRGPTSFNCESQARASQLRASGVGPVSHVGAPHEGRRIPETNRR
jgi:hypothetical protein